MIVAPLAEQDLAPVAKLCRIAMPLDSMPDFLFKENTLDDPDFNPATALVAREEEGGDPVGFLMGVIRMRDEGPFGYVKLACVRADRRRRGVARELLERVEKNFRERGVKRVRLFESHANYYMPGVDPFYTEAICFFERMGYKKFGDTSNLVAELSGKDFSTETEERALENEGVVIKRAAAEDKDALLSWTTANFKGWETEVANSFLNDPISLHVAELDGEPAAFSAYEANNRGTGWFGPMGTQETLRGKGVGGILLKRCLADMKAIGFVRAIIPWVGPIPFYSHYADAKMSRVLWRYEKTWE
ncbi:MAG: GNAT family N-acetyltransferase [Ignavibacteriales bacterium]|nr:GNAT family N-acetyltransferase [Ignavibacteriales bacterium]